MKIKSNQCKGRWVGRLIRVFSRSKQMDVNDFLIYNSALNIRLYHNLVTKSHGDPFL